MIIWTFDWWKVPSITWSYAHMITDHSVKVWWKKFMSEICTRRWVIDRHVGICSTSRSTSRAGSFSTVTFRMGVWGYRPQRAELNIEVSPKTAKFENFVFPPIFKNRLLTFLRDALTKAHPSSKYQFNWIENNSLSTNQYHSFNNWKRGDLRAVISNQHSWQPRSTFRSSRFYYVDV